MAAAAYEAVDFESCNFALPDSMTKVALAAYSADLVNCNWE